MRSIMTFLADRILHIKPSPTLAITAKAASLKKQGIDVISLGAGEPDFDTPDNVKKKAIQGISEGFTKYTSVDGMLELKKAIQAKFLKDNNIAYELKEIMVSLGAKHVIYNAFQATLNPGDQVIIPAPYWVSYPDMVELAQGTPVFITCPESNNFCMTADQLVKAINDKTKWVILNSPSNPTGALYAKEHLTEIADILRRTPHVHVLSDDIYEHLVYGDEKFHTLAQIAPDLKDRILTVNGVSKTYAMTGWRIGYGAGNSGLIKAMTILQSQSTSNPVSISQFATVEALNGPQDFITERNKSFKERRDMVVNLLNQIPGITCSMPQGAFYVYPSCQGVIGKKTQDGIVISSDTDFVTYLLDHAQVAVVPGEVFGLSPYFRISYATDAKTLKEAINRLHRACEDLK